MSDYTCKIADFGLSIVSEMKSSSANRGTMLYMPPETLRRKWYYKAGLTAEAEAVPLVPPELLPKIDIYSYGLILWEIYTETEVFLEYNEIEEFCSAICDKDARPKISPVIPVPLSDIISKCWSKNSKDRPDFREVVPQIETARIKTFLEYRSEVTFWQSYYPTKPRVPFSDFIKALWRYNAKINKRPERTCSFESKLSKLMTEDSQPEVSLETYGRLLAWFGPLNEKGYFEDFCNIMQSSWFCPQINNGVEAQGFFHAIMIQDKITKGLFCVRLTAKGDEKVIGERRSTPFTITFIDDRAIGHIRIARTPEGYTISWKDKSYKHETLVGLINHLCQSLPNYFAQSLYFGEYYKPIQ